MNITIKEHVALQDALWCWRNRLKRMYGLNYDQMNEAKRRHDQDVSPLELAFSVNPDPRSFIP